MYAVHCPWEEDALQQDETTHLNQVGIPHESAADDEPNAARAMAHSPSSVLQNVNARHLHLQPPKAPPRSQGPSSAEELALPAPVIPVELDPAELVIAHLSARLSRGPTARRQFDERRAQLGARTPESHHEASLDRMKRVARLLAPRADTRNR